MSKLKFKSFWLVLMMLCTSLYSYAADYDFAVDGIYYKKSGTYWDSSSGTYKYNVYVAPLFYNSSSNAAAYSGDVVVPETVEYDGVTYPVKGIYDCAFYGCANVTSVTLPSSVTAINSSAFLRCTGLEEITMPGVTYFGHESFRNCSSLKHVTIAEGTTTFSNSYVFYNCSSLESVELPSTLTSISSNCFDGCSSLTTINIPDNVSSIGSYAFYGCTKLASVHLPFKLTSISECTFYNCSSLGSVTLPDGIISLGNNAFYGCSSLESINFPEGLTTIGSSALYNCSKIANIDLPQSLIFIGGGAFTGTKASAFTVANGNTNYVAQDGVLYTANMKQMVVYPCGKAGAFTIPSTIESIGNYAFSGATGLTSLTVPASVTTIGDYAFNNCTALKELTFEDGENVLSLGSRGNYDYGLFYKNPISTLYLGRNLAFPVNSSSSSYIKPFYECPISTVTIGVYVSSLQEGTFMNCGNIKTVNYTGTLAQWCGISFLDDNASPIKGNTILLVGGQEVSGDLVIPNGVTEIGARTFQNVKGLTSVTLPSTVTSIGDYAFDSSLLSKVIINGTSPASLTSTGAFRSDAFIFVPDAQYDDYIAAPVWSSMGSRIFAQSNEVTEVTNVAENGKIKLAEAVGVGNELKVVSLKVHGTINGYDIMVMNTKMKNLRYLDLSDATIVEDEGFPYASGQSYVTQNNVLGAYSFYNLTDLRTVVLPKDITAIGNYAFSGCTKLTIVSGMPETCTSIGSYAFNNDNNLQNITLGSSIETIGSYAFNSCSSLAEITFPATVSTISSYAFRYCPKLKELSLPTALTSVSSNAFANCSGLTSIEFPRELKTIGSYAFSGCSSLEELKLPTELVEIQSYAFNGCTRLKEIHIPSMLTKIGDYAFTSCGAEDVYAYTLAPIPVSANTFDYNKAVLHAPNNPYSVFLSYYTDNGWRKFLNVLPFEADYEKWYLGENLDVLVKDGETIPNKDGEQAEGEMQPGSGLTYLPGSFQWLDKLQLNWKGGKFPAFIDNGNVFIDELTFCLDVQAGKWYFFSFPFEITLDKSKFNGKFVWRYYDGEQRAQGMGGWMNIGGNTLHANTGYIFQTNKSGTIELTITDPIFTGADKTITLDPHASENAQDAGWNFVGNPNLSYYDVNHFLSHFNSPITVWDPVNNTYNAVMPGDDDYEFHPFEAFFVQKPVDAEGMTFEAENRETSNGAEQTMKIRRKARARMAIDESRLIVNLTISDGKQTDKTRVVFNDEKAMDYEMDCDASKFMSSESVPQLYTLDSQNVKYAINERPNADNTVRLGYTVTAAGTFTIGAPRMDMEMALKDLKTGYIHNFRDGDYDFQTEAGAFDNRFMLVPANHATKMQNVLASNVAKAVEGGISLNGLNGETATIYNVGGAVVAKVSEDGVVTLPAGTYVVSMGDKSVKLVVK